MLKFNKPCIFLCNLYPNNLSFKTIYISLQCKIYERIKWKKKCIVTNTLIRQSQLTV